MSTPYGSVATMDSTSERTERAYTASVFQLLVRRLEPQWLSGERGRSGHKIDERGCWPNPFADPPYHWSPLCDLDGPERLNPMDHPALPFPFTARQLAAFLMDGVGAAWCERLGGWDGDPVASLVRDDSRDAALEQYGDELRDALRAAWASFHETRNAEGGPDLDNQVLERGLFSRSREDRTKATDHFAAWRRWMVTQLLSPAPTEHRHPRPPQAFPEQERVILTVLRAHDLDPLALPSRKDSRPGVKNMVRQELRQSAPKLFHSQVVFDKAWGRLSKDKKIRYASDPSDSTVEPVGRQGSALARSI